MGHIFIFMIVMLGAPWQSCRASTKYI
jgi:hypothetical protein